MTEENKDLTMSSTRKGCRGSPRLNAMEPDTTVDSDAGLNLQSKEKTNEEQRETNDSEPPRAQQQPVSEMRRKLRKRSGNHSHFLRKPFVCGICNAAFKYEQVLVYHVRSHTGEKPYECDMCDFSAIQPASLQKHKKTAHRVEISSFDCEDCGLTFSKSATLKLHRDMHESQGPKRLKKIHNQPMKGVSVVLKDIATGSSEVLLKATQQSKTKAESTNVNTTEVYSSSSDNPKQQNTTKNTESVELFLCEVCSFTCHGEQSYEQHMQQHKDGKIGLNSKIEIVKPSTSTVLEQPEKLLHQTTDFEKQLIAHRDKDRNKYWLCSKCSYVRFTKKSAFVHHMVSCQHRVVYSCESCDYICVKMYDLQTHKKKKHPPPPPKLHVPTQVIYSCEVCCFMTSRYHELSAHRKRAHILPDLSFTHFNFKQKIIFSCDMCDYVSSSLVDLNLHKLSSKHKPEVVVETTKPKREKKSKKRSDKTSRDKSSSNKPDRSALTTKDLVASPQIVSKSVKVTTSDKRSEASTSAIANDRTVINVIRTDDPNRSRKIIISGIKCPDCQQSFRSAYDAEYHRKEVKDNWYQCRCHVCKYPGKSPCDLECHKQRFHRHVCKMCDVNCGTEYKLMSHTQLVHPFIFKHKYGDRKIQPDLLQPAEEVSPHWKGNFQDGQSVRGNKSRYHYEGKYAQVAVPVVPRSEPGPVSQSVSRKKMKLSTKSNYFRKIETPTDNCIDVLSSSSDDEVVAVHEFWPTNGSQRSLQNSALNQRRSFEQKHYTPNLSAQNRKKTVQMGIPGMVQFSSMGLPLFPEYGKSDEQRQSIPFPLFPVEDIEDNLNMFQINKMHAALLSLFIDEAMLSSCRNVLKKRKRWAHYSLLQVRKDSTSSDVSRVNIPRTAPSEVNREINKNATSSKAASAHQETEQSSMDRSISVTLDMIRKIQLLVREGTLTPQLTREIAPHCQVICNQYAALQDKLHHVEIINFIITKRTGIGIEALAAASAQINHSPSSPTPGSSQQTSAENNIQILKNLLVSPVKKRKSSSPARKCKTNPKTIETKNPSGHNGVSSSSGASPRKRTAGQDIVATPSKRQKSSTESTPHDKTVEEEDERNLSLYMYSERKSKKAAEEKMKACSSSPRNSASQQSNVKCKGQEFTENQRSNTRNEQSTSNDDRKLQRGAHTQEEDTSDRKVVSCNGKKDENTKKNRVKINELKHKKAVVCLKRVSPRHHSRKDPKTCSEHAKNNKLKGGISAHEDKSKQNDNSKSQRASKSVKVTTNDRRSDSKSENHDVDNRNLRTGNKQNLPDKLKKLKMQDTSEPSRTLRRSSSVQHQEEMNKGNVKRYPRRHDSKMDEPPASKRGRITRSTPSPKY